jgi:hypothetical protein
MTDALNAVRYRLALLVFVVATLLPARGSAEMPTAASLLDYGFRGFTLGAECGLAAGYLSTGPVYPREEWRKLVLTMGVGALAGMTTGFILAVADVTAHNVPVGYFVLRDTGYGTVIGAAMGAVVGMLIWVDNGTTKDVLEGAAYGTLIGAVAGIAYGIIDARYANGGGGYRTGPDWRVSAMPMRIDGALGVGASLSGKF